MNIDEWLSYGIQHNYCGPPVCATHDGIPTTAEEDDMWEDGSDPCAHVIRVYSDDAEADAVEANHSPSIWRKSPWNLN